jgi:hypothetical protein
VPDAQFLNYFQLLVVKLHDGTAFDRPVMKSRGRIIHMARRQNTVKYSKKLRIVKD